MIRFLSYGHCNMIGNRVLSDTDKIFFYDWIEDNLRGGDSIIELSRNLILQIFVALPLWATYLWGTETPRYIRSYLLLKCRRACLCVPARRQVGIAELFTSPYIIFHSIR